LGRSLAGRVAVGEHDHVANVVRTAGLQRRAAREPAADAILTRGSKFI
jgi:hypothetical protein